jgi:hypothetical protein
MSRRYALPDTLAGLTTQSSYVRWLSRIALHHVRRDRERGNALATRESYMLSIHAAVVASDGRDAYTGEALDWHLISTYDNAQAAQGGRAYKATLAMKPTVDHVGDGLGPADFRICAWRTNQAKGDLAYDDFVALCRRVIAFHDTSVSERVIRTCATHSST